MWVTDLIRKVVARLFPKKTIEEKLKTTVAVSVTMQNAIQLWGDMYGDAPPWKSATCKTMNLPASIAHEFSRLITVEHKVEITGSPIADYLNRQYDEAVRKNFKKTVELYCAKGGVCMKPYVSGDTISVDLTQAEAFYPTAYDSNGNITGAVFVDQLRKGARVFTRLEIHEFQKNVSVTSETGEERITNTYTVRNKAYRSEQLVDFAKDGESMDLDCRDPLHEEIKIASVPEWASLSAEETINDVERPLFVYVKVPSANNVDSKSPLGASVYARAVQAIQDCDEQYTQSKYEYDAFEAAINADADLFKKDHYGQAILPSGKERVFRDLDIRTKDQTRPFIEAFAPEFRDSSLFNGLDHYLKIVELNCELAYGTFSDPGSIEKTAEEIRASKQRSYSAVSNMQEAWDEGIKHLVYAMYVLATLYGLAPNADYPMVDTNILWGDGVLEDMDKEYQRRLTMVNSGMMRKEAFLAWYFGCSEAEALAMMPQEEPLPEDEE